MSFQPDFRKIGREVTILNGQSLSSDIDMQTLTLVGIILPAGITTGSLTFQGCLYDEDDFFDLYDSSGAEVTVTITAGSTMIVLDPVDFNSCQKIKVRNGTSGSPTNVTGNQVIKLILRQLY